MNREGTLTLANGSPISLVKNPPIVEIKDLTKEFGQVIALKDVNLEIPEGNIIGLLGPNGSGKTTLIKILAGLYTSYSGSVAIDGERPGATTKAKVAYMPDVVGMPMGMCAKDVVKIYEDFFEDFDPEKCFGMLNKFEIEKDKKFNEMSKGTIDKVKVSFTMARKARLYLLDEPLGGVDVGARDVVLDTILENFDSKGTIIVATHLISEIERLFDSAIILKQGELVDFRGCDEIRMQYGATLEDAMREIF